MREYPSLDDVSQQSSLNSESDSQESNKIATQLSSEAILKQEVILSLLEPCDRSTYGQKLIEAAARLGCSTRTVQRLAKKWEQVGSVAFTQTQRADKGQHRIDDDWTKFITKTYVEGNKNSKRITPAQVAIRVKARAHELGLEKYPSHMTVYRVLEPVIAKQQESKSVRSVGWKGSRLAHKTKDGSYLQPSYSNHVWQCDHTRADVMLVDQHGELIGRPWLTTVVDSYSRCIVGINLGFDAPSSQVVALALRHAILSKNYGLNYKLNCEWGTYGRPEHIFTDSGKDFRSNHAQQISLQLGISWHFRDRPSEGGIVERPFGVLNTQFFSTLLGYTGSNVQERPEDAEKSACLTLRELELLLVRFLVDQYNQSLDARMGNQTRFQRWEAGLIATPSTVSERELDICLMKQTRRTIYKNGYVQFENLMYRGENLAGYAGENVVLRYDPRDMTTVWVYRQEGGVEVFLARAFAQDLETEQVSLDETKAASRQIRKEGKTINNRAISEEVRDRDIFLSQKKNRKQRQKEEQALVREGSQSSLPKPIEEAEGSEEQPKPKLIAERPKVLDYDQLQDDYGW
ncbi:MAG: transposase [Pseudanabaena frigida]|uniref:Transposase n=1 Tax=Pseudanabaena frigida TaxID=945775 RepID=A0A2W4WJ54_9CYAN|nr:MAG: transposase [Pseudanabaena frigida]